MPRTVPESELEAILTVVAAIPAGVSLDGIVRSLDVAIPRRTLQRRLARLVEDGRLVAEGRGRASRYYMPYIVREQHQADGAISRDRALSILARLKPELQKRFGITRLALFGSTAQNTARADSDVDIVVGFDGPATSQRYFGVQFLLEDELGHAVDLVTDKAIRSELKPCIEREAIDV